MHELSIALSLLEVVSEEVRRRGDIQVKAIHLKLGPLAGVVKEALVSAFELAREGSGLAAARLVIQDTPLLGDCPRCGNVRNVRSAQERSCIECGTAVPRLISGRELEVTALEIQ